MLIAGSLLVGCFGQLPDPEVYDCDAHDDCFVGEECVGGTCSNARSYDIELIAADETELSGQMCFPETVQIVAGEDEMLMLLRDEFDAALVCAPGHRWTSLDRPDDGTTITVDLVECEGEATSPTPGECAGECRCGGAAL